MSRIGIQDLGFLDPIRDITKPDAGLCLCCLRGDICVSQPPNAKGHFVAFAFEDRVGFSPCGYRQKWITWFFWSRELDGLRGRDRYRATSIDREGYDGAIDKDGSSPLEALERARPEPLDARLLRISVVRHGPESSCSFERH